MAGQVVFRYDASQSTVFSEDHAKLESREQVDVFIAEYQACWNTLGRKCWLVANIDDLLVAGQIADSYAGESLQVMWGHLLGFARWATNSWARMSVRTTALRARMPAVIHSSQDDAVAAIAEMKRTGHEWRPGSSSPS